MTRKGRGNHQPKRITMLSPSPSSAPYIGSRAVTRPASRKVPRKLRQIFTITPASSDGVSATASGTLSLSNFPGGSLSWAALYDQFRFLRWKGSLISADTGDVPLENFSVTGAPDFDFTILDGYQNLINRPASRTANLSELRSGPLALFDMVPCPVSEAPSQNGGSKPAVLNPKQWVDTTVDVAYQGYIFGWHASKALTDPGKPPSFTLLVEADVEFAGPQ